MLSRMRLLAREQVRLMLLGASAPSVEDLPAALTVSMPDASMGKDATTAVPAVVAGGVYVSFNVTSMSEVPRDSSIARRLTSKSVTGSSASSKPSV
jgi:hypothetical protein